MGVRAGVPLGDPSPGLTATTQAATAGDFKQATTLTGRFIRCVSLIRSYTVLFAVSSPHAWE